MLRLDVDGAFPYAVPADNPFVGNPAVRDEIWHLGLRHPWRWCFDEANGDMWIADVGQVTQEELNYVPAGTSGLNFGWKVMEGTHCIGTSGCPGTQGGCGDAGYTTPILTQGTTTENCSIAGGFVYRGSALPAEQGNYFFGGYCTGDVWSMKYDGSTITDFTERNTELGQFFFFLTAFGIDDEGEIYILLQTGEVYKIVEGCAPPTNYCPANTNSAGTAASISMTGTSSISKQQHGARVRGRRTRQAGAVLLRTQPGLPAPGRGQPVRQRLHLAPAASDRHGRPGRSGAGPGLHPAPGERGRRCDPGGQRPVLPVLVQGPAGRDGGLQPERRAVRQLLPVSSS